MPASDAPASQVLVTWPDYDLAADGLGTALERAGLGVRLEPKRGRRSRTEMRELLQGVAGAIVSTDPFDADVFAACPELRVIARVGIGVDSIDLEAATRHGVAVTITPGANEGTVADHTLALMLACVRRVCEQDRNVRAGKWTRTGDDTPWALHGKSVGIVGFGRIGRLVAERLRGFETEILVTDPAAATTGGVETVQLPELLRRADVVTLHVPLLPSTRGLLGAAELAAMRPEAILVNTSRGGVLDEAALLDSLQRGALRGAALDVFADEPPPLTQLLGRDDVVLSPHNAGLSVESVQEMTQRATASVIDVLSGRAPDDVANPAVLESLIAARLPGPDVGDGDA